ncbi:MAG: ribosomal RNA small subunit methyltransferase A [Candidatus Sungbacteria bacterium]|uniref:Ribosomal RNA small subunit methyltransferase A n=1 Tax=Candidatus Sungiibacteriota bacterium TaxID=2750080 RepID=A0A932VR36_9BACT|nr:ribosomal RNA small subunit methyltransferase A [Candidatus Sungbacteria bacterium]
MRIRPKKSLGQHFLTCPWVADAAIGAADLGPDDTVLEIGPGTGVLTRALAKRAGRVIAVEKDQDLAGGLADALANKGISNVAIVTGDILRFDLATLPPGYKVAANIPYYLTARLIRMLLETKNRPTSLVLAIQKEVAQRIVAKPPDMNMLALLVHSYADARIIADVPASCFRPKPKVTSSLIKISRISEDFFVKNGVLPEAFFSVAKKGFSSKRKMLGGTLRAFAPKKRIEEILARAGVRVSSRPQELSRENWAWIVRALSISISSGHTRP